MTEPIAGAIVANRVPDCLADHSRGPHCSLSATALSNRLMQCALTLDLSGSGDEQTGRVSLVTDVLRTAK